MKLAAVLIALAAAAAAAPGIGPDRKAAADLSISQIDYNPPPPTRKDEDQVDHVICLENPSFTEANPETVIVSVRVQDQEEMTGIVGVVSGDCVTVAAPMPAKNKDVQYALVAKFDPPRTGAVKFTFEEIEQQSQITCNAKKYKVTDSSVEEISGDLDGCRTAETADNNEFKYCQSSQVTKMDQLTDDDGLAESPAESLAYSKELTLGATTADTTLSDNINVVVVTDVGSDEPQTAKLSVVEGKGVVELVSFKRGTATYTACPVVKDFTAYTITDLDIIGTHGTVNGGASSYYQFGFNYDGSQKKFKAISSTTGEENTITINCKNMDEVMDAENTATTRCYGYLEADEALSLSYYIETDPTAPTISNSIIVDSTTITRPEEPEEPEPEEPEDP